MVTADAEGEHPAGDRKMPGADSEALNRTWAALGPEPNPVSCCNVCVGANVIRVFISHSSRDVALAKLLIDLIRSALRLSTTEIRCTSVAGYRLQGGAQTDAQLREEILAAPVFVGVITEAGLTSAYVLFELGARWGTAKQLIPLMAPGISPEILQGPISSFNALSCASSADLHQLISQIAEVLDVRAEPPSGYQNELELVTEFPPAPPSALPHASVPTVPQTAVDELAELRSEGVHEILNRSISTEAKLKELSDYNKGWWGRIVAVLERDFSKAEQLNFTRLGTIPDIRFPHTFNEEHAKILREFALQERRLLDIIARHTR